MYRIRRPGLLPASLLIAIHFALPCAAAQPSVASAGAPGVLRVERAEIIDAKGFEKPLLALTMMVPAGWRHQGDIRWNTGAGCTRPYQPRLLAQSLDGQSAIELHVGEGWGASSSGVATPGCPQASHASAQAYLAHWVQRHRQGAQWLEYRPRPDRSRPGAQQPMPGGGFMRTWAETGQALIAYTQGGRPVREVLAVSISFTHGQFAMPGGPPLQTINGESFGVLGWRAPEDRLDLRQFDALWQTLRREPEWQARIDAGMQQMAQDNAATQARIGQIHAETSRQTLAEMAKRGAAQARTRAEIAEIQQGSYRDRAATDDRMHRETVRTVREVNLYRAPEGGATVELPSHYRHAWQLRDGSYVLTDKPDFDPARDLGMPGKQLQRTRD